MSMALSSFTPLYTLSIPSGGRWSMRIGRGKRLVVRAEGPGANAALWLYRADHPAERLNVPDTLKAQHTAKISLYDVLMSDEGRAMATVVHDTVGWHDPLSGVQTRADVDRRYGETNFQRHRNAMLRSGYENAVKELVRNGLDAGDLVPPVNLFSKVWCDESGRMHFVSEFAPKGSEIGLRMEMDVIAILSNTPHPLDPRRPYPSVPLTLSVYQDEPTDPRDPRLKTDEARRAMENTVWQYALLR
ncbi:urea amidolyase associated protein UAAP1 [Alicyclobacillus acidocaldarius]|uniref:urea amidolyase associated protein UAAP1 n=1 Tax=Alicyclobacillus acidocaldarius TaxID=405212 RepID=UPI00345E7ACA